MIRSLVAVVLIGVCALLAGCGVCDGVVSCSVPARFAVEGTLVEAMTGEASAGARVDAILTGGPAGATDSLSTVTDSHGFFHLETEVGQPGAVTYDVKVSPRGRKAYRIRGLVAQTHTVRGEATELGRWVSDPYFRVFTELATRVDPSQRLRDTSVSFQRVSGPEMTGAAWTTQGYKSRTDGYATVLLFGYAAFPDSLAPLTGDLLVPFPGGVSRARITLFPTQIFYAPPASRIIPTIGPSAMYEVTAYDSVAGHPVPGTTFTFTRTGGPGTAKSTYSDVSGPDGNAILRVRPLGFGNIVGTLTVTPPAPYAAFTRSRVTLKTFDSDSVATLGTFALHAP